MKSAAGWLLAALLTAEGAGAVTWYVDDNAPADPGAGNPFISDPNEDGSPAHPFDRVKEAVDAAAGGDTVLILPGTYLEYEIIDLLDKDLVITSRDGPEVTIIDHQEEYGSAIVIADGQTRACVVNGLTITRGTGTSNGTVRIGGAIQCYRASPTISSNILINNYAHFGGAIDAEEGNPLIIDNVITGNEARDAHVRHISGDGGGISLFNASAEVYGNRIYNNTANRDGGGISINGIATTFAMVVNCANNQITGNQAVTRNGGGIAVLQRGDITVRGCTIAANSAVAGSGMHLNSNLGVIMTLLENSILFSNAGPQARIENGATLTVRYSDVQGGQAGVSASGSTLNWGAGNVNVDPMFVDETGDYHLQACSPLVDAGDPAYAPAAGETDVDGDARLLGQAVDIGADEVAGGGSGCDANCDGSINGFDIQPFVDTLVSQTGCSPCAGDVNGDGSVNGFDIQPFVECLSGP